MKAARQYIELETDKLGNQKKKNVTDNQEKSFKEMLVNKLGQRQASVQNIAFLILEIAIFLVRLESRFGK